LLNADTQIGDRRVAPGDVAVLSRTNQQSADMQAALTALGVPSVMYGDKSVFDTPEANALDRVMRAMAEPSDGAAIAAALLTPLLDVTGDGLAAARRDEHVWEAWVERFQSWSECWKSSGFTVAFRRLLDDRDVLARLLSRPGGERSITNVLHLGEMLQQAAVDGRRGPLALIEWLQRMRHDEIARAEHVGDAAQIRLESDTKALKLITVHKSKGLQYPVVVCPFLWDAMLVHREDQRYVRWHDPDQDNRLTLDLGSERRAAHEALFKREALAEHLRLLYVALTRAEQLCVVAWGPFAGCEDAALGYLLHQAPEAPEDGLLDATKQRIKSLSEAAMRADVERLAAASDAAIEMVELSADQPAPLAAAAEGGDELRLRTMPREVRQPWRLASFSALAAVEAQLPEPVEEGVDRDEAADAIAATLDEPADAAVRGFPRGRRLGNLVHKLFEIIDFSAVEPAALHAHAQRLLPGYGVEAQWADAICGAIGDVLDTPLDEGTPPLTLRQVPRARRLTELEFVFPVALDADGSGLLTAAHLAEVFARAARRG
jgi:exodeoxyribonuclease V beta subunit